MCISVCGCIGLISLIPTPESNSLEVEIKTDTKDSKKVAELSYKLTKLIQDYENAYMNTAVLFAADLSTTDKETYDNYINEIKPLWLNVEKEAEELNGYIVTSEDNSILLPFLVKAQELDNYDFGNGEVELNKKPNYEKVDPTAHKWSMVESTKGILPKSEILKLVQNYFKVSAKDAYTKLEEYQGKVTKDWLNTAEKERVKEMYARIVLSGSKISLFVGGTIISFGAALTATTATGIIGGTITTSVGTVVGGADMVMTVGETGMIIAHPDEEGKIIAQYAQKKEDMKYFNNILLLYNTANMIADPQLANADNLGTIYDLVNNGYEYVVSINKDKVTIQRKDQPELVATTSVESLLEQFKVEGIDYDFSKLTNPIKPTSTQQATPTITATPTKTVTTKPVNTPTKTQTAAPVPTKVQTPAPTKVTTTQPPVATPTKDTQAEAQACYTQYKSTIDNARANNARQDPSSMSLYIMTAGGSSSCTATYNSCVANASAVAKTCTPDANGFYTACITQENAASLACANAEISCSEAAYKSQCGVK